ncbi:hypothetical protein VP01_2483g1 [Puccinia sorghi]|uniref:Uncharacterized protein n=1 Tax=Puccinia sorghi TaxID=27349 RepID=A0A0L6V5S0_9BASI|nr:hypothetical protein VP01_2483g1 [Puccinia sorghi]
MLSLPHLSSSLVMSNKICMCLNSIITVNYTHDQAHECAYSTRTALKNSSETSIEPHGSIEHLRILIAPQKSLCLLALDYLLNSNQFINLINKVALLSKLSQLPEIDMQKLPGSFCFYSNLSPRWIQPIFDAQSLCTLHSERAKTSTYGNRWSLDDSLDGTCCMSTAGILSSPVTLSHYKSPIPCKTPPNYHLFLIFLRGKNSSTFLQPKPTYSIEADTYKPPSIWIQENCPNTPTGIRSSSRNITPNQGQVITFILHIIYSAFSAFSIPCSTSSWFFVTLATFFGLKNLTDLDPSYSDLPQFLFRRSCCRFSPLNPVSDCVTTFNLSSISKITQQKISSLIASIIPSYFLVWLLQNPSSAGPSGIVIPPYLGYSQCEKNQWIAVSTRQYLGGARTERETVDYSPIEISKGKRHQNRSKYRLYEGTTRCTHVMIL